VLDEDPSLLKGVGVEEELDPLAGGQPPFGMKLGDTLLAASFENRLAAAAQLFDGGASGQIRGSGRRRKGRRVCAGILSEPRPVYNAGSEAAPCPERSH